jgi:hypothetical protein
MYGTKSHPNPYTKAEKKPDKRAEATTQQAPGHLNSKHALSTQITNAQRTKAPSHTHPIFYSSSSSLQKSCANYQIIPNLPQDSPYPKTPTLTLIRNRPPNPPRPRNRPGKRIPREKTNRHTTLCEIKERRVLDVQLRERMIPSTMAVG